MSEGLVSPERRRNYYLLILSVVSMQITASTIYMVFPLFFAEHGISNTQSGVLISIGTLAGVFSGLLAGKFSDSYGRKWILVGGTGIYAIVFYLFAFMSKDFTTFFVLRFFEGIGFYVMPVLVSAMCADTFGRQERGRMMSLFSMAGGIGQLIGPLSAPYLIKGNDYTMYFIFSGTFVLISAIALAILVKETLPSELRVKSAPKIGFNMGNFIGSVKKLGRPFMLLLVAILLYRTGYTLIDPFFSVYMREVLNLDLSNMSYLFALRAVCTLIFAPIAGYLADKWGRKPTFVVSMALVAVALVAYTQMTQPYHIYYVRALDAIAGVVVFNSIRTITADLLAPEVRGFGMGLYSTISQESSTVGAIFGGYLIDVMGYNMVFLVAALLSGLSLGIVQLFIDEPAETPVNQSVAPVAH
ncbi:MAG: MFS transporter [Candidatus Bathyarchaeota archaeon]|nr:MFS transporter [Candidatus Bathyarchaeota archaeon]